MSAPLPPGRVWPANPQPGERDGYVTVGPYRVPKELLRFPSEDDGSQYRTACRIDAELPQLCAQHGRLWPCYDGRPNAPAPSAGQDTGRLRDALRVHHPIMRSETGPFSGCRCGGVKLGQDVIAHVVGELQRALDDPEHNLGT